MSETRESIIEYKPERTGKWIVDRYCSECEWDKHEAELVCNIPTNYCPNCGARMEETK